MAGLAAARTHLPLCGNTVSLATAPEPGSRCSPKEIDDNAIQTPNLWGNMGVFSGVLYEREQDGVLVYSTRNLPGSRVFLKFTVATPPGERPRRPGWAPQLAQHARSSRPRPGHGRRRCLAARVAHAESNFDPLAVSSKGAQGVMQLMPETAQEYGVRDPFRRSSRSRRRALRCCAVNGDRPLAAAAYNAGIGAVTATRACPTPKPWPMWTR